MNAEIVVDSEFFHFLIDSRTWNGYKCYSLLLAELTLHIKLRCKPESFPWGRQKHLGNSEARRFKHYGFFHNVLKLEIRMLTSSFLNNDCPF